MISKNAKHENAAIKIDNLIGKIKSVLLKSRAALSDEEVTLLEECISDLELLKKSIPIPDSYNEDVGRIVLLLLKFFLGNEF